MNIIVDVNHPAHVHYFKNFVWDMQKRGHEMLITASEKEMSYKLLDLYGFNYVKLGTYGASIVEKIVKLPILDLKMYEAVKDFNPDLFIGFSSIRNAHVSRLMRKPCIALDDTEHAIWGRILYLPFTNVVLTPSCFRKDLGKKQIRYNGYQQLAYLHPKYFKPDTSVLNNLNISKDERFIVLRFVSWDAIHDMGQHGIKNRANLVKKLEKYGRVLITSEGKLEKSLEKYRITLSPEKFHDLLWYASLYFGEGGTTASESAVLGTHSIHLSSEAKYCGIFYDQRKYGLLYFYDNENKALKKAISLLQQNNLREIAKKKREIMLRDKINITEFLVWFIENYPQSFKNIKTKPQHLGFKYEGVLS